MADILTNALARILIYAGVFLAVWLPILLSLRWESRRFVREAEASRYILRQPRFIFWLGIVGAALCFALFVLAVGLSGEWIGFLFVPFSLLSAFLTVYASRWRIVVTGTRMEIFRLVGPPLRADMNKIDRVEQLHNRIVAYQDGRELFTVEMSVVGYPLLYEQLHELGKMDSTLRKNAFSVRRSKAELVVGILSDLFFGGLFVYALLSSDGLERIFGCAALGLFFLLGLYLVIAPLRWRIDVSGDRLTVQKALGRERTVPVQTITRVNIGRNALSLLSGGKTLIRVEPVCKGFATLVERLRSEDVPFYRKGRPVQ